MITNHKRKKNCKNVQIDCNSDIYVVFSYKTFEDGIYPIMKIAEIMEKIQNLYASGLTKEEIIRHFAQDLTISGNIYQEMEMNSLYVDSHQDISYTSDLVEMHSHAFYEILFCSNAANVQYLLGSTRYQLHDGDLVFIPPGVSHSPLYLDQLTQPYHRYVIWISNEFMERARKADPTALPCSDQPFLLHTHGTQWAFLEQLFQRSVLENEMHSVGWRIILGCFALQIMVILNRATSDTSVPPPIAEAPELLDRVLAYIQDNLSEKITLERTARYFLVSESTIRQTFQKRLGISFYRCVTQIRLIRAKVLIQQGLSMDTVSTLVGFADYSAFYRAFKQRFGVPPTEYRNLFLSADTATLDLLDDRRLLTPKK